MPAVHCFTSASFSYLDRVLVLVETIRRHHADWVFWLCLSDRPPSGISFDPSKEVIDHVVRVDELGVNNLPGWIFQHDVVELCTAVKGLMLLRLFDAGAERVIYLDPDIAVFSPLDEAVALLDQYDIVLTPHITEPQKSRAAVIHSEIGSLKHGVYNLGFLAVANTSEGQRFARWWCDRLIEFCFDDIPGGLFTDQRWCDLAPVFFPGAQILRHPGYNVASWNLRDRPITIEPDGSIRSAGKPLKFFHFTKVNSIGDRAIDRNSGGRVEPFELMEWYRSRLEAHARSDFPADWWAYGIYDDGTSIPKEHRIAYRTKQYLRLEFPNPFAAGSETFAARLAR